MQIDHDPRELPRKAIKFVAIATTIVCLSLAIPVVFGVSWVVNQFPKEGILPVSTLVMGVCAGFFIGRWDALRGQRTPGNDG